MGTYFTPNIPNLGALNVTPYLPAPSLPNIVAEWAAIIPLVFHLADYKRDYHVVGQVAMTARISTGIFPRLGDLAGTARLLNNGPDFVDQASSCGNSSRTVRDVIWGGSFPAANGSASLMIAKYALVKMKQSIIKMPDTIPMEHNPSRTASTSSVDSGKIAVECKFESRSSEGKGGTHV